MRILVIGASGFVGTSTAEHLSNLGHKVVRAIGPTTPLSEGAFRLDVSDPDSFAAFKTSFSLDAIVNCAGIAHRFSKSPSDEFQRVNVEGARNVARFASETGAAVLVHLSSVLVYGKQHGDEPINEQTTCDPEDVYARSKLEGEEAAAEVCRNSRIPLVILRPAPIIGAGGKGNIFRLIRAIDRRTFVSVGNGLNRKSLVCVEDVARSIAASLELRDPRSVFNVVGETVPMRDVITILAKSLGRRLLPFTLPTQAAKAASSVISLVRFVPAIEQYKRALDTWLSDSKYSARAIRDRCGFEPRITIEEGLRRQVDHYIANR